VSYTKSELEAKIADLGRTQSWKHAIQLPYGVWTAQPEQVSHGKNLVKWRRIKPYLKEIGVHDKRVLDVGCSEGFFSLEISKIGAAHVLGIDASQERIDKARFVQQVLGASIEYEPLNIYDPELTRRGPFDLTLCLGVLHRVPDPHGIIQTLTRISSMILFEWKCLKEGSYYLPVMKYAQGGYVEKDIYSTPYWLPSIKCIEQILNRHGFRYQFIHDDSRWRRVILISSREHHAIFNKPFVRGVKTKPALIYETSRRYVGELIRILRGELVG